LADLQRAIQRPTIKRAPQIPKLPTPEQATQKLAQIAEIPLQSLEGLQRVEQHLGQIEALLRSPPVPTTIGIPEMGVSEKYDQLLTRVDSLLQKSIIPKGVGVPLDEGWIKAQISSASVAVGASQNLDAQITDFWGRAFDFAHVTITQVALSAAQLVAADAVRLRLYRRGTRSEPQDLLAEFDGTSQVTGMWAAAFTSRQIEYSGLDELSKVYLTVRNTSGNSGPTTFQIFIYGYRYPAVAPAISQVGTRRSYVAVESDPTLLLT
jgi:hypothetical protein